MTGCATQKYESRKVMAIWKLSKLSHEQSSDPAKFPHFSSCHLGGKLCTKFAKHLWLESSLNLYLYRGI